MNKQAHMNVWIFRYASIIGKALKTVGIKGIDIAKRLGKELMNGGTRAVSNIVLEAVITDGLLKFRLIKLPNEFRKTIKKVTSYAEFCGIGSISLEGKLLIVNIALSLLRGGSPYEELRQAIHSKLINVIPDEIALSSYIGGCEEMLKDLGVLTKCVKGNEYTHRLSLVGKQVTMSPVVLA